MPKLRALFILGLLVIILPFMGFPGTWKMVLSIAIGFLVSSITFLHYKDMKKKYGNRSASLKRTPMFVENEIAGGERNFSSGK